MDSSKKYCVINAGVGRWYPAGSKRLERSLIFHGFAGDILTWDHFPNSDFNTENIYNIKASCIQEAHNMGYTHILWADCSMWAINPVEPIFDIIDRHGFYAETNGNNCAQECSDACLLYFKKSRDEAEKIPMCSSGLFGINLENPKGLEFAEKFILAAKKNIFNGSREHDNQSDDARFLHHRQDQSAASLIINEVGLHLHELGTRMGYYNPHPKESIIFQCKGL